MEFNLAASFFSDKVVTVSHALEFITFCGIIATFKTPANE